MISVTKNLSSNKFNIRDLKNSFSEIILYLIAFINILFFVLVICSLFIKINYENISSILNTLAIDAILITFRSIFISVCLTLIIGLPTAFTIVRNKNFVGEIINFICIIPLVLPPSVIGLALLMTFGKNGIFGSFLSFMGLHLAFSFYSLIIVQVFIMTPIFILIVKNGMNSIDKAYCEAAMIEGAGEKDLFFNIYLPLSKNAIITAIILCILRTIGEFGATIMFAGNLQGKTQTITTAIYLLYQTNIDEALSLAVLLVLMLVMLIVLLVLFKKKWNLIQLIKQRLKIV